jgi:regulator of sigma E protease
VDGSGKAVPYLGVQFDPNGVDLKYVKTDVVTAVKEGFIRSAGISLQILDVLKRAATRNLSEEEVKGIGGPVKIAQATGEFSKKGPIALLLLSAMLSVNLGLMNLLPFPALDGGRILFLGYELVARKPIDARKEGIAHTVGMVMLLAFMLFITARDILPFITKQLS